MPNIHTRQTGNHFYFYEVPTRWHACYLHQAFISSGLRTEVPALPFVDDEYAEHVSVFQSVLRADPDIGFSMVELGARWGTWGARAIKMLTTTNNMNYSLLLVEADKGNCEGLRHVMEKNKIQYTLDCNLASPGPFLEFAENKSRIDLIDLDIQGAELDFLNATFSVIESKVSRLIIGTHSIEIHAKIKEMFEHWLWIHEAPHTTPQCADTTQLYLRGGYDPRNNERFKWEKIIEAGCYHETPFGKVSQCDGEIIVDNPRFMDQLKTFSLSDKLLNTHKPFRRVQRGDIGLARAASNGSSLYYDLCVIVCGERGVAHFPALTNSILMNPSGHLVHLHILSDEHSRKVLGDCLRRISRRIKISVYNIEDFRASNKNIGWLDSDRYTCAFYKLNLAYMIPSVDKLLVVDADMIILEDLANLWAHWKDMDQNEIHFMMVAEAPLGTTVGSWYNRTTRLKKVCVIIYMNMSI